MRRFLPYFQLCRIPAVFSAIADICLGFLLTHRNPPEFSPPWTFGLLVASSCGLYLSGMVFNDIFDRHIDARERPFRPIPSGRVSLADANRLGIVLCVLGNLAAGFAGTASQIVALLLTICIFAYNAGGKATLLGPVLMGSCRGLNIMLGASGGQDFATLWTLPQLHVAAGLAVYIMGVTLFAAGEAERSSRWKLLLGVGVLNLGLALLVAFGLNFPAPWGDHISAMESLRSASRDMRPFMTALGLLMIMVTINRRTLTALFDPSPQRVQATVRTLLMSLISLDAILTLHVSGSPAMAIAVMALLLPALWLGRYMSIT